jgi:hypothetical protein
MLLLWVWSKHHEVGTSWTFPVLSVVGLNFCPEGGETVTVLRPSWNISCCNCCWFELMATRGRGGREPLWWDEPLCLIKFLLKLCTLTLRMLHPCYQAYEIRVQNLEQQGNKFMFNNLPQVTNRGTAGLAGTCSSKRFTYNNGIVVCILLLGGICSLFIYRVLCDA